MGNELRFRSVMDDKTSGSLDKMRKKFDDLRKAGTQGIVIGASAAVTAKAIDGITNAAFRAGQAIGDFVSGSIQDASNLQQSVGAVESVFGNMAGRITDFGNEAADAIGLSRREVNELGSVLGAQLQGMGFDLDETSLHVINLEKRAADMAATFGGQTSDAVRAISALMRGERDPIERYGVSIKAVDVQARVAAKGLDVSTAAAQKKAEAIAGLELLMEATAKTEGQFAREADSAAGSSQRLQARMENLSAEFGEKLLPFQVKVNEAMILFVDNIEILMPFLAALGVLIATVIVRSLWSMAVAAVAATGPFAPLAAAAVGAGVLIVQGMADAETAVADLATTVEGESRVAASALAKFADDSYTAVEGSRARMGVTASAWSEAAFSPIITKSHKAEHEIGLDLGRMVEHFDNTRAALENAASAAADAIYDPIINAARRAELEREAAEIRTNIKLGKLRGAEKTAAQGRLAEIAKELMVLETEVFQHGNALSKEATALLGSYARKLSGLSGEARADMLLLLREIGRVRAAALDAADATFSVGWTDSRRAGGRRQHGGPVSDDEWYLVGEDGPEVFIPNTDGMIVPNSGPSMGTPVPAGSGEVHVNLYALRLPGDAEARAFVRSLIPDLRRELAAQRMG